MSVDGTGRRTVEPDPAAGSLTVRALSGARWSLADQALQQVLRLGLTVALSRLVEPAAFGVIALAFVVVQLGSFLTEGGMSSALVRRADLTDRLVSTAMAMTLAAGLLLALLVAFVSGDLAELFEEPGLADVLVVLAVSFPVKGLTAIPRDLLRRQLRFRPLATSGVLSAAAGGAVGIALAVRGAGVWALVAYFLCEAVVLLLLTWRAAYRAGVMPRRPSLRVDRSCLRYLIGFGGWVSGFRLLYWVQLNLDNVIVGKALGATALAYYGLAYRVMLFPLQKVADGLAAVAYPAMAAVQHDPARLRRGFRRGARLVCLACFPLSAGAAVCAPLLVPMVFGDRWSPAVVPLQILCLNGPRLAIGRLNGSLFQAVGRPQLDVVGAAVTTALYLPAFLIGVEHGISGMAWAYTAAGYAGYPLSQWLVGRCLAAPWWWPTAQVAGVVLATTVLVACSLATQSVTQDVGDPVRLLLTIVAGAVGYVGSLRLLTPALFDEARRGARRGR